MNDVPARVGSRPENLCKVTGPRPAGQARARWGDPGSPGQSRAKAAARSPIITQAAWVWLFTTLHAYLISPNWGGRNADRSINTIECEERERSLKKAQETMEDFLASTAARTSTLILEGDPQAVLSELVEKNWPDLVIAGTHGRSPIEHGTIGSVAELYLMTLPCDVLVVPTRQN